MLINICQYGIPETGQWLQTTMQVCFWVYLSFVVFASSGIYLIIWSTQYAYPFFPQHPHLLTHKNIPNPYHDTNLDLPRLSSAPNRAIRRKPHRQPPKRRSSRENKLNCYISRCNLHPRDRLPRQPDDLQRLHLPPHDTEASSRTYSARNGKFHPPIFPPFFRANISSLSLSVQAASQSPVS